MIEKPSNQVMAGEFYFKFTSVAEGPYTPPESSPYPSMRSYILNTSPVTSSTSNLIGTGSKTFFYSGTSIVFAVGDLIKITALFPFDISGNMLASVTSFSYDVPTSTATMGVDVYQFTGSGTATEWRITQQWGSTTNALPLNVVQNPNSPHTAKLTVFDWDNSGGQAQFSVPSEINNVTTITSDTPTHFAGYTVTEWKWNTYIVEDNSDLHKPWLGTTVTVRVRIKKVTTTLSGSTEEFENRDYTHTFTADDFNPSSPYFTPGVGHLPSTCNNFSATYIDSFTSTFDVVYDSEGSVISSTYVNYYFDEESRVIDLSPGNFFDPPG